ncbi:MAG: hypothetical protein MZW92_18680 [Comamonadaceae bacterium]|nr:hypothetical protein [Comamonadaceae bacterium]
MLARRRLGARRPRGENVFLARERHVQALRARAGAPGGAAARADAAHGYGDAQLELFAEELRLAGNALGEITGEFTRRRPARRASSAASASASRRDSGEIRRGPDVDAVSRCHNNAFMFLRRPKATDDSRSLR